MDTAEPFRQFQEIREQLQQEAASLEENLRRLQARPGPPAAGPPAGPTRTRRLWSAGALHAPPFVWLGALAALSWVWESLLVALGALSLLLLFFLTLYFRMATSRRHDVPNVQDTPHKRYVESLRRHYQWPLTLAFGIVLASQVGVGLCLLVLLAFAGLMLTMAFQELMHLRIAAFTSHAALLLGGVGGLVLALAAALPAAALGSLTAWLAALTFQGASMLVAWAAVARTEQRARRPRLAPGSRQLMLGVGALLDPLSVLPVYYGAWAIRRLFFWQRRYSNRHGHYPLPDTHLAWGPALTLTTVAALFLKAAHPRVTPLVEAVWQASNPWVVLVLGAALVLAVLAKERPLFLHRAPLMVLTSAVFLVAAAGVSPLVLGWLGGVLAAGRLP